MGNRTGKSHVSLGSGRGSRGTRLFPIYRPADVGLASVMWESMWGPCRARAGQPTFEGR
jgi:hypothetical protein